MSDPKPRKGSGPAGGETAAAGASGTRVFSQRYRVLGRLGKGGLGEVLLAFDEETRREVALKIMRGELSDPRRRRRFFAEAMISSQLQHPGIVPIYTIHNEENFYTMRPISGNSLGRILRLLRRKDRAATEAFPLSRLVDILISVAQAVGYAHHRGVVHGDLKPHNIMVGDYGEVLTLDWGLARLPKHLPADLATSAPLRVDALVQSTLNQSTGPGSGDELGSGANDAGTEVNEADTVDLFDRHDSLDSGRMPTASGPSHSSVSTRTFARSLTPDGGSDDARTPGNDSRPDLPEVPAVRPLPAAVAVRSSGANSGLAPSLSRSQTVRVETLNARVTIPDSMQPDKNEPIAGTPSYMAPEVVSGHLPDYAADVYSLGVTLYECLTLQKLHTGKDVTEIIAAVKVGDIPAPHKIAPDRRIPLELSRICMTALERKSRNRYASALTLAAQLKKFREGRTNWHLIYRENFIDRPKPASWEQISGAWSWDSEGLALTSTDSREGVLHFVQACPRDLRIEIEGLVLPDQAGELALIMSAKPPAAGHRKTNGYCFQFGANGNIRSKIAKDDVDLVMDPSFRITPGMVHSLVAERRGDLLRLLVDDVPCLEYRDMVPLTGPKVGFYTYGLGARIHRISIYGGGISEVVSCLSVPDDYFNNKKYDEALRRYLTIADAMPDTETGLTARMKAGLCMLELGNLTGAESHFDKLADSFYQGYQDYGLALVAAREKNYDRELQALTKAVGSRTAEARDTARLLIWERITQLIERGQRPDHALRLLQMVRNSLRKRDGWQYGHHAAAMVTFLLRDFRYAEAETLMQDIETRDDLAEELFASMTLQRCQMEFLNCRFDNILKMTREFETEIVHNPTLYKTILNFRIRAFVYTRRFEAAHALLDSVAGRGNLTPVMQAHVILLKSDALLQSLRPQSAWQALERAASMFQNVTALYSQILVAQANLAIRLGRYRAALQLLKKMPTTETSRQIEENSYLLTGVAHAMLNDARAALQGYRQVLLKQNDATYEIIQTAMLRSAIVSQGFDAQQAQKFLEQAEARGDIGVNARLAAYCLGKMDFETAHADTAPAFHDILCFFAGEWEQARGQTDTAKALFNRAMAESPMPLGWVQTQAYQRLRQLGEKPEPPAWRETLPPAVDALDQLPPQ